MCIRDRFRRLPARPRFLNRPTMPVAAPLIGATFPSTAAAPLAPAAAPLPAAAVAPAGAVPRSAANTEHLSEQPTELLTKARPKERVQQPLQEVVDEMPQNVIEHAEDVALD